MTRLVFRSGMRPRVHSTRLLGYYWLPRATRDALTTTDVVHNQVSGQVGERFFHCLYSLAGGVLEQLR